MRKEIVKEIVCCDKCGNEIPDAFWTIQSSLQAIERKLDICNDCMNKFLIPDEPEPAPDPDEPKPKKSRKIDRGKVWSLKDAGWKVSAIAGDMRCSEATIYNILNEGRPDEQK